MSEADRRLGADLRILELYVLTALRDVALLYQGAVRAAGCDRDIDALPSQRTVIHILNCNAT
jgi:hypothetical protein